MIALFCYQLSLFPYIFGAAYGFPYRTYRWNKKEEEEDAKTPIHAKLTEELLRTEAPSASARVFGI